MKQLFFSFLIPSCVSALLTVLLALVQKFIGRIPYRAWLLVLAVAVLPIRLDLPVYEREIFERPAVEYQWQGQLPASEETVQELQITPIQKEYDLLPILSAVWIIVAAALFAAKYIGYLMFVRKVRAESEKIECPLLAEYTVRRIDVRIGGTLASPLLYGVFRPTLLLPSTPLAERDLRNILAHETTHLRRGDVLSKWFVLAVKCLHWFNPAVSFAAAQFHSNCEISCDLAVVQEMDESQKLGYINTILRLVSGGKAVPLTTGMTGDGRALKRRFLMIKHSGEKKFSRILSVILVTALALAAAVTSGVLAGELLGYEREVVVLMEDTPLQLENTPIEKDGVLYLPIRELLEQSGIDMETVTYEKGYFQFVHPLKTRILQNGDVCSFLIHRLQTGACEIYMGPYYGSTENETLKHAPFDRNGVVYAPYEWFVKVGSIGQGLFENLRVPAYENQSLIWPVPSSERVSAPFSFGERVHNGLDIAAQEGEDTVAAFDGTILTTGFTASQGNYIILQNESGMLMQAIYTHLASIGVQEGDTVTAGQVIGTVGKTGQATGAHLHFELMIDDKIQNPMEYFR